MVVFGPQPPDLDREVLGVHVWVQDGEVALGLVEERRNGPDVGAIREPVLDEVHTLLVIVGDADEELVGLGIAHASIFARTTDPRPGPEHVCVRTCIIPAGALAPPRLAPATRRQIRSPGAQTREK